MKVRSPPPLRGRVGEGGVAETSLSWTPPPTPPRKGEGSREIEQASHERQGDRREEAQWLRWRSLADLYHAYFTGLVLTVVTRRGTPDAAEFIFRVFRRQQQERFLPGLKKLGIDHLPPAVAAAQYHYLSNWIGGVHVEYMV